MAKIEIQTRLDDALDSGAWIGRRQAFATIAGACSAADAESLRQIRRGKKYRACNMNWEEFCAQRLGLSRATADRIILQLEEFGPQFFTLAQITGISPVEYRRLAPQVGASDLLHSGESIAITPENAPRLIEAMKEMRGPALPAEPGDPLAGSGAQHCEEGTRAAANANSASARDKALAQGERHLAAAIAAFERARAGGWSPEEVARLRAAAAPLWERLGVRPVLTLTLPRR